MGDIADMMMDGTLCRYCGAAVETRRWHLAGGVGEMVEENGRRVLHTEQNPGYPVPCEECSPKWKPGKEDSA